MGNLSAKNKYLIGASTTALFTLSHFYFSGGKCQVAHDMTGKTVLVTGGNRGIGLVTAKDLASRGAKVVIACRSKSAEQVVENLKKQTGNDQLSFIELDLSDFNSIREFSSKFNQSYKQLDILVNNAGIYQFRFQPTQQGFESNFGVNHLGHFLLTNLLLPTIQATPKSRIVVVSSRAHLRSPVLKLDESYHKPVEGIQKDNYEKSKLANILFAKELASRLDPQNTKVVSLHPGVVRTSIFDSALSQLQYGKLLSFIVYPLLFIFGKSEFYGAQTTLTCCYESFDKLQNGAYYRDNKVIQSSELSNNKKAAEELWEYSSKVVELNK